MESQSLLRPHEASSDVRAAALAQQRDVIAVFEARVTAARDQVVRAEAELDRAVGQRHAAIVAYERLSALIDTRAAAGE